MASSCCTKLSCAFRLSVNSSSMLELSSGVDSAVHASGATLETIHTGRDLESVLERPGTGTTRDSTSGQSARMIGEGWRA